MITFWIIVLGLCLMATAFIALPLYFLTKASTGTGDLALEQRLRDGFNVSIFQERLTEYQAMLDYHEITQDEFSQLERELQATLLWEAASQHEVVVKAEESKSILPLALPLAFAALIPLLALTLYADFGLSWGSIADVTLAQEIQSADVHDSDQMMQMVIKLTKHLDEQPDNPNSWFLLAHSYMKLQQYERAADAFKHLLDLYPQDPNLSSYYAEAIYMANNHKLAEPISNQATKMRSLQVLVEVADTVESDASASVFVFARAVNGPPMPLAAHRLLRSELPKLITLDESMAMITGVGLANFDQIQIVARISSSGSADVSPDDYEALSATIDLTQEQGLIKLMLENRVMDK